SARPAQRRRDGGNTNSFGITVNSSGAEAAGDRTGRGGGSGRVRGTGSGVQGLDIGGELLGEDRALDAELGRQVPLLLGEVAVEYSELPDRLRPGHRLVRVV